MTGPSREGDPQLKQTIPGDMHTLTGRGLDVAGVEGISERDNGVHGTSAAAGASGVYGDNTGGGYGIAGRSMQGIGVLGEGGKLAGHFIGDVEVTGDIRLANADCAEDFDIVGTDEVMPGTVMVLDEQGALHPSSTAYDKRVAGVLSGAGSFRPGIVLDRQSAPRPGDPHRMPIALLGKVYCLIDANYASVEAGDLLTSSPTSGHAMKAADPTLAFGAVIGKALLPIRDGQGLVPILVTLQ